MTDFATKLITAEELAYPNGGVVPALSQYEFVPQPGPFVNTSNDKVEGATQIGPIDPHTGRMGFLDPVPDPPDPTKIGVRLICTNDPNLQDAGTRYWLVRRRMQGQPLQEWAILVSTADPDVLPLNQATRVTSVGTTISAGIRVNEVDGTPDVAGVTQVTFGNGTVTDMGGGHVQVAGAGGGGGGTVTSVGLTMPGDFSVANSPVTGAGTLAVTATNQAANQVKAGPATGAAAAPTYRALVPADLPAATTSAQGATVLATPSSDVTAGHVVQANDARLSDARTPAGAAGGDLGGTYPNPTLANTSTARTNLGLGLLATLLGAVARTIISKAGSVIGTRRQINFVEGTNITITVADDNTNEKVDVTIAASGGGGGMTNPMTTAEDLIKGGVAGAPTRFAKGADDQILKMVSGALTYAYQAKIVSDTHQMSFWTNSAERMRIDDTVSKLFVLLNNMELGASGNTLFDLYSTILTGYLGVTLVSQAANSDVSLQPVRAVFIKNSTSVPAADPSGGGFLYSSGGALYWRGSGGTVTPLAPA